jgi:hypothetical protein
MEEVQLYIELPFFLMMAGDTFQVRHGEATLNVEVVHDCVELQLNYTQLKNHGSAIFVAKPGETEPGYVQDAIYNSRNGHSARHHRTTLIITTSVHRDVLVAYSERPPRRGHASLYLAALMVGHLPVVNRLIGAYRRAAHDPFAMEVTDATAPIGFLRHGDRFLRISAVPYYDMEKPCVHQPDGRIQPLQFATTDECREKLADDETPGEPDLLDAWAYFFAGRFGDAIRSLVSAIEVLLESLITWELRNRGKSDEDIRNALMATATRFQTRLDEYLALSKRTLPDPILSWFPELTGVYLRNELTMTRRMRHRIVHEGHRLDPQMYGTMLRAVETMTWLYSWMEMNDRNWYFRSRQHQLKNNLRGRVMFDVKYTAHGVMLTQ